MAHHKSALKRIRQNRKKRLYNRANKRLAKDVMKSIRNAKTFEEANELLKKAYKILDRISAHGVIHKNNAANKKSKLSKLVNTLKIQNA